ncbi:MAG: Gfo/Idh/MocA family oxidoreductase [Balneolaceae bacterium]
MINSQKAFGIGIAGCGSISDTHAEAILQTKRGKLVSVFSRSAPNRERLTGNYDLTGFSDYSEFLSQPDLHIVVICTPSGNHLEYGMAAAEAGKHVVVEKPIEINTERGGKLITHCKKHNVKLAVIYQNRFFEQVVRMKKSIDNGEIGSVFMASGSVKWYRDQEYYSGSPWRGTLDLDGGGALINQSIHTIDLLQWFNGGVKSVLGFKGTYTHDGIEGEDNAVAALKFNNGAIGVFEASTSINPPQQRTIEIHGEIGTALLDGDIFRVQKAGNGNEDEMAREKDSAGASSPLAGMTYENHKQQYDRILEAIQNDYTPPVSGEESLQSLAVVEAIYRSAKEGRQVDIEELLTV